MKKIRIGFVIFNDVSICRDVSPAENLMETVESFLQGQNVELVKAEKDIKNAMDALSVSKQMRKENVEALVALPASWTADSLLCVLAHEMRVPVILVGISLPGTFALACTVHYASVLKQQQNKYFCFLEEDPFQLARKIERAARAVNIAEKMKTMRIALIGSHQSWRTAGSIDFTLEELKFSQKLGPSIIHIEMDELWKAAKLISADNAARTLDDLVRKTGKPLEPDQAIMDSVRLYLAVKDLMHLYDLTAVAAQCYPMYNGVLNLVSSWLADEGIVLDVEGDIGHTLMMCVLNLCAEGEPVLLAEAVRIDEAENYISVAHDGSSAYSFAEDREKIVISSSDDGMTAVTFPVKAMTAVTVLSILNLDTDQSYRLFSGKACTLPVTQEEWERDGSLMVAHLRFGKDARDISNLMIKEGMDHHLIIKEGDYIELISMLCELLGIEEVKL